jgi:hypothetical protein
VKTALSASNHLLNASSSQAEQRLPLLDAFLSGTAHQFDL